MSAYMSVYVWVCVTVTQWYPVLVEHFNLKILSPPKAL